MPTLSKHSPLSSAYRRYPVQYVDIHGWQMAAHFGNPEREREQNHQGAILADWSHIGKISLSGPDAAQAAEHLVRGAIAIPPLTSLSATDRVALRLAPNDYLVLCQPGVEPTLLKTIDALAPQRLTVINQTGALGCVALAGPRRDEVIERSTAMNLRRDQVGVGAVIQTTFHTIRCTLYRTPSLDILLQSRSLSESLFDALLDVGFGVGLTPTGLATLPVHFN